MVGDLDELEGVWEGGVFGCEEGGFGEGGGSDGGYDAVVGCYEGVEDVGADEAGGAGEEDEGGSHCVCVCGGGGV